MKANFSKLTVVFCICAAVFSFGLSAALAGSEVGGKVTNNLKQASGIAISSGIGDATQGAVVIDNSKVKGDVTNNVDQQSGIAMASGAGKAVQASIVVK